MVPVKRAAEAPLEEARDLKHARPGDGAALKVGALPSAIVGIYEGAPPPRYVLKDEVFPLSVSLDRPAPEVRMRAALQARTGGGGPERTAPSPAPHTLTRASRSPPARPQPLSLQVEILLASGEPAGPPSSGLLSVKGTLALATGSRGALLQCHIGEFGGPFHLSVRAAPSGGGPALGGFTSSAISTCEHRLALDRSRSNMPETWFKDKGGKRNVISVAFQVISYHGLRAPLGELLCKASLLYESGDKVNKKILDIRHADLTLGPDKLHGAVHYRINEVSKNHHGRRFVLQVTAPEGSGVMPLRSPPVSVRSKVNNQRGQRDAKGRREGLRLGPFAMGMGVGVGVGGRGVGGEGFPRSAPRYPGYADVADARAPEGYPGYPHPLLHPPMHPSPALHSLHLRQPLQPSRRPVHPHPPQAPPRHAYPSPRPAALAAGAYEDKDPTNGGAAMDPRANGNPGLASTGQSGEPKDTQSALRVVIEWVRLALKLPEIEWKLLGYDAADSPLYHIPGSPNEVIEKILGDYSRSVQGALEFLVRQSRPVEAWDEEPPAYTGPGPSPHGDRAPLPAPQGYPPSLLHQGAAGPAWGMQPPFAHPFAPARMPSAAQSVGSAEGMHSLDLLGIAGSGDRERYGAGQ